MADPGDLVEDDLLRLVLMCTHPALATESACALALRLVLGVSTHDIAPALPGDRADHGRAADARQEEGRRRPASRSRCRPPDVLPERLETVAQTAYLAFTAGYAPGSGPDLLRAELAGEAIRLVRVVLALRPGEPALVALLALMLLQHSRRDARVGRRRPAGAARRPGPRPVAARRDRRGAAAAVGARCWPARSARWRRRTPCRRGSRPSTRPRPSPDETRWDRIVGHYDLLLRADAQPERPAGAGGRGGAGRRVRRPGWPRSTGSRSPGSHRVDAVRAELLVRAGRVEEARAAYDAAIAACRNEAERAHLVRATGPVRALTRTGRGRGPWSARAGGVSDGRDRTSSCGHLRELWPAVSAATAAEVPTARPRQGPPAARRAPRRHHEGRRGDAAGRPAPRPARPQGRVRGRAVLGAPAPRCSTSSRSTTPGTT